MKKLHTAIATTLLLGAGYAGYHVYNSPVSFEHKTLTIISSPSTTAPASHQHEFTVEIAASEEQGKTGLAGRASLDEDHGMLFPIPNENVSMWMKNTQMPLDIIFIKDNLITKIISNTIPLSEDLIPSGEPVTAVLELNSGVANTLHIQPGDHVQY